jgi:hypothetical protein
MSEVEKPHPLLQKPLLIYSLPSELLDTLTLKGETHPQIEETPTANESEQDNTATGKAGCTTCNMNAFENVSQQREHVRSDLHKFNLKRKVSGQPVVMADEFDKMLDGTLSVLPC